MNIFDLDKKSLPEQVQINKDDIKDIKDNLMPADLQAAKDYADEKDADTLQAAKDYTDDHTVDSDHIDSDTATAGQVLTADGDGGASWDTPSTTVTASDVDSETATAGQVLTADGNGGASWQNVSGGSENLIWSGSLTIANGSAASINDVLFNPNKKYRIVYSVGSSTSCDGIVFTGATLNYDSCGMLISYYAANDYIVYIAIRNASNKATLYNFKIINSSWSAVASSIAIKEIYEV